MTTLRWPPPWVGHGQARRLVAARRRRRLGQPLVRACFPPGLRAAVNHVHDARHRLYAIAEALPRTLCHLDFWAKNLVRRPDGAFALFDWAFVGDAAVGEDVGNLVRDAVWDHFIDASELPALEAAVLDGYCAGLTDAGWTGDLRLARLGMLASAVKYDWMAPLMLASARSATQTAYGGAGQIDPTYRFEQRGRTLAHNAAAARRALELADQLGL